MLEKLLEAQTLNAAGLVPSRGDGALDNEDVGAGFLHEGRVLLGALGGHRDGGDGAARLHLLDALCDEVVANWLLEGRLEDGRSLVPVDRGDLVEDGAGIVVAGPDALEVEDAEATRLVHEQGEVGVNNRVHGGGDEGEPEVIGADVQADLDELGVDRDLAGNDGDIVEPVGVLELLETWCGHGRTLLLGMQNAALWRIRRGECCGCGVGAHRSHFRSVVDDSNGSVTAMQKAYRAGPRRVNESDARIRAPRAVL